MKPRTTQLLVLIGGFLLLMAGMFLISKCQADDCLSKKCPAGLQPNYGPYTGCLCVVRPQ